MGTIYFSTKTAMLHAVEDQQRVFKFLILNAPFPFEQLHLASLYDESQFLEELAKHLLGILKREDHFVAKAFEYIRSLGSYYATSSQEISVEELVKQSLDFFVAVRDELRLFSMYRDGVLPFNTIWLDKPDTIIFFKMEPRDV